jgi:adenylate cyclase
MEPGMTGEIELDRRGAAASPAARLGAFFLGPPLPVRVPERVQTAIRRAQDQSEVLVSVIQLGAICTFAALYALAPKAFGTEVPFEPVPVTLGFYALFTIARLWLALKNRLTTWFLTLSVMVDVAALLLTIWSFHFQYQAPPALYLKAPTLMYVFILIALRTLRFEPGFVILTGVTASLGWIAMVAYAVLADPAAEITRDFRVYMMSYQILLGAEFDKVLSMLMVTLILAIALLRARKLLITGTTEHLAAAELSRFFDPAVAGRIRDTEMAIKPGEAELREAAIVMTDLRGFTPLAERLPPREVMALLSEYQSRVVGAITAHGGNVDKFMGDGILASFGAEKPSATSAADALRALDQALAALAAWREERRAANLAAPAVGAAVTAGRVMFGAIGDGSRLEYTVIGDPVNLAAKLEKHTKVEGVAALCPEATYRQAIREGYAPPAGHERREASRIGGVGGSLDLVVLAP